MQEHAQAAKAEREELWSRLGAFEGPRLKQELKSVQGSNAALEVGRACTGAALHWRCRGGAGEVQGGSAALEVS